MPKKPTKYGLKIMCLCDSHTCYLNNAFVYLGKENRADRNVSIATSGVLKLMPTVQHIDRNITVDNWFLSIEFCEKIKENGLTVLGILNMN